MPPGALGGGRALRRSGRGPSGAELDEILAEHEIQRPVEGHPDLPLEAGEHSTPLLLKRLQDSLDRHNAELNRPFTLSLSVGVSAYHPEQCQTIEEVLAEADRELYRRKRERA